MLEADPDQADADPAQLSTAMLNMAINARDAMPDGGTLTLKTANVVLDPSDVQDKPDATAGRYVMIAVSDSGTGIPAHLAAIQPIRSKRQAPSAIFGKGAAYRQKLSCIRRKDETILSMTLGEYAVPVAREAASH